MRPPALLARWRRLQLGEPFELLGGGGKRPRKTVRDLAKDDAKLLCAIRSDEKATPEWARELLPSDKKKQKRMPAQA